MGLRAEKVTPVLLALSPAAAISSAWAAMAPEDTGRGFADPIVRNDDAGFLHRHIRRADAKHYWYYGS
jgi:hypothetical protein